MSKTFNFSANAIDFGDWTADTKEAAQESFAQDAGYSSWGDMLELADEFGGNAVEVREVLENGQLSSPI